MNETKQPSTQQKNKAIFKSIHRERGQAMVETAFVMIILLVLLSLIIDLGRAFFTYLALQNAAGEGAYYATKYPIAVVDSVEHPDPNNITFRVKHESPDSPLINWDTDDVEVTVSWVCPNGDTRNESTVSSGTFAVVTVFYQFKTIGPVAGMLAWLLPDAFSDWDGTFPLKAETKQLVLEDPDSGALRCD